MVLAFPTSQLRTTQARSMLTMNIIHSLINIFSASLGSGNIKIDTELKELSYQVDCLQRAHALHRGDTNNLSNQVLEKIDAISRERYHDF